MAENAEASVIDAPQETAQPTPKEWVEVGGGTLSRNERKERVNQPDFTGSVKLKIDPNGKVSPAGRTGAIKILEALLNDGKEVKTNLSGWQKEDDDGNKFISLSLSIPTEKQESVL